MRRIVDSLVVRIALTFLIGLFALQAAIVLAVLWPDGRPATFRLVEPEQAAAIARALESASPAEQPLVLAALNDRSLSVRLLPGFPDEAVGESLRPAPRIEQQFAAYAAVLGGRTMRVQIRDAGFFENATGGPVGGRGPIRLLLQLRDGRVVAIERAPIVLQRLASRYYAVAATIAAILLAVLAICLWQIALPIARLARATRALTENRQVADVEVRGAGELKMLAGAFNTMKATIGGLVADRTRVLAAIAHDLRTYLTRLRLRVEMIEDADQRRRAAADLGEMSQLLDDVLLFARDDAAAAPEIPLIDLGSEVATFVALRGEMGEPVTADPGDSPIRARCEPLALRRILANLVDNALRYGGAAHLHLYSEGDHAVLRVEDDGPGVPEDTIERLTAPFERLEPSRGRHSGGAGLGLSIVKALVESNRGTMTITNRPAGGLTVEVRLPGMA